MKARPVAIIWNDAHHIAAGEWVDPSDLEPGVRVTTVGLLIEKSSTHYTVAHSLDDSGLCTGTFSIPRVCVHKFYRLSK